MATAPGSWAALDAALEEALRPFRGSSEPVVVLFSGGADSGLLAWELRREAGASLFTVGRAGSSDLEQAAQAAPLVGLRWTGLPLDDGLLAEHEDAVAPELDGVPGPRRGIFVALAAAVGSAPPGRLVCGQGADELFLGYAHFRGLPPEAAAARARTDLQQLLDDDWPRTVRIARRFGRVLHAPYLDPGFVRAASQLPVVDRLPGTLTKELFRTWAAHRGLPTALASRPKRALQYGTGVDRWLRRRGRPPA